MSMYPLSHYNGKINLLKFKFFAYPEYSMDLVPSSYGGFLTNKNDSKVKDIWTRKKTSRLYLIVKSFQKSEMLIDLQDDSIWHPYKYFLWDCEKSQVYKNNNQINPEVNDEIIPVIDEIESQLCQNGIKHFYRNRFQLLEIIYRI